MLAALVIIALAAAAYSIGAPALKSRRSRADVAAQQQRVATARQEAMSAEAGALAKELFAGAGDKEREAEQLFNAGKIPAALTSLREAEERFQEAARSARAALEARAHADRARAHMVEEKQRAAPQTAAFGEAVAVETEAENRYRSRDFSEAAAKFDMAAARFAAATAPPPAVAAAPKPSPAPPPQAPTADASAEIRELIRQYTRVFETKDLGLLEQIRPRISPDEMSRHRQVFEQTRSYRLTLKVDTVKVSGDSAEARGRREDIVVTDSGEKLQTPSDFVFRLKRVDGRWTIDAVK